MTGAVPPRVRPLWACAAAAIVVLAPAAPAAAQSLRGSPASMDVQNRMARTHDFTFLRTSTQVKRFVNGGYLVRVVPNRDFGLHAVSFPYARPEVALFIERLGAQYRAACGERLIVTSLTRPISRQPRNASARSVHPTGMAVDLRRSSSRACRDWLEGVLLRLERAGVLEATRERWPPHYHVAVFPEPYADYLSRVTGGSVTIAEAGAPAVGVERVVEYRVRPGDSLWTIARRHGTTIDRLRAENGLRSDRIYAGQVIDVPMAGR